MGCLLVRSPWAFADAPPPSGPKRASLELSAPSDCARAAELRARVARRSPNVEVIPGPAPNSIRARLWREGAGRIRAEMIVERADDPPYEREIVARTCDEALEAVAFMIAVALDPSESPDASPAPVPVEEPSAGATERDDATPPTTPAAESALVPFLGAGARAVGAAAPKLLLGAEITGGLEWTRGSVWSPALRVVAGWATTGELREVGGTARFSLASATLEVCPLRGLWGSFSLRPCAFGAAGQIQAVGTDTLDPQSVRRPWWVVGGSLLLTWSPLSRLRLTAAARAGIPGVRDTFEFEPRAFHRAPAWAPSASIGAEVPFP